MLFLVREARAQDVAGIAAVESEVWRDSYAGLLPEVYLVRTLDARRREGHWRRRLGVRNEVRLVAVAADATERVAGYAVFGRNRLSELPFGGELFELYVKPDAQGIGIGRRLCAAAARRMERMGLKSACVEVLERNPSRFFYEALGGRLVARKTHAFGSLKLPSLVYGWSDLATLVGENARRTS